jgi:DNA-binding Lrp family transcriptional regulator
MMICKKELKIISEFRKNSRESLTRTSRKLGIPVSTIYDRLRKYDGNLITKHTAILDFKKLGFGIKVMLAFKIDKENRDNIINFLETHHRVNSIYRISNNSDFLIEVLFKDLRELNIFTEKLETLYAKNIQEYYVVEDIKKENFLTSLESIEMLADF